MYHGHLDLLNPYRELIIFISQDVVIVICIISPSTQYCDIEKNIKKSNKFNTAPITHPYNY